MKRFFGVVLLLCAAAFLFVVFRPEQEDPVASAAGAGRVFASSQECRECHAEIYEQWERSSHAIAWTDPAVRKLSNDFANQDCIDCHAPRPVLVTGIGERVLPRTTRRHEGVDCLACHLLPDGRIAGTVTNDRAACRPVATLDLAKPEFCAGCHNQHKTVDQWRESQWPDRDQDCSSCHMPYPLGDPNQARDHFFPGGNVLALVQQAVELRGHREGQSWVVELENTGAGHSFPTDERSRAADLFWRPLASTNGGPEPWRHLHRMRDPYRTETELESTLLAAHEVRRLTIAEPDAAGAIEVALFYKRSPYWSDPAAPDPEHEAQLVHTIELRP